MGSDVPKALLTVDGQESFVHRLVRHFLPVVDHVVIVIQSKHLSAFQQNLFSLCPTCDFVMEDAPMGTGHSFLMAVRHLCSDQRPVKPDFVLCLNGDTPLVNPELIEPLFSSPVSAVVGFLAEDPQGYGRILQHTPTTFSILEENDCTTDDERRVRLVNSGIYWFYYKHLVQILDRPLSRENQQNEYYITQYFALLQQAGLATTVIKILNPCVAQYFAGVNTPQDLDRVRGV